MSGVACFCVPDDAFPFAVPVDVCSCCKRRIYRFEEIHPHVIGIMWGLGNKEYAVSWNCPRCGSTQSVLWAEASHEMRRIAENVGLLAAMTAAEMPAVGPEA
ncbi:MAG: hypothetical protein C4529_15030 [Deltaproteobacteria bacterium]|nr:MAG: hypothetical protein C4529_15030 [Deltaproteobacteria bacterium]